MRILQKILVGTFVYLAGQFVLGVLQTLGLWSFMLAIVTSTIVAVRAIIDGLPTSVAFVLMLATFAIVLFIIWFGFSLVRLLRGKGFREAFNHQKRTHWQQEWHDQRDVRREFWRLINTGYRNWGQRPDDRSLQDLLGASRFPSELPLNDGRQFPSWVWAAPNGWDEKAKLVGQFTSKIYPGVTPAAATKSQLMGGGNEFDRFDDLRRELSKFWDHWGRQEPLEQVIREQKTDGLIKSSAAEIKLLTFLEIARSRWEQTGASGKGGLFRLGRRNEETES